MPNFATFRGHLESVECLINLNANTSLLDSDHKSAEDIAMEKGYKDIMNTISKYKSMNVESENRIVV